MSIPEPGWTDWQQRMAAAMRAELDWAPMRFGGWEAYEQARPLLPGETYETVARWPDQEYVMVHRPQLGELVEAWQSPIDTMPLVTVTGAVTQADADYLRAIAVDDSPPELHAEAALLVQRTRTIPVEPPIRTGRTLPPDEEMEVHYEPMPPRHSLEWDDEAHQDHVVVAYGIAGEWHLRLGPPVGITRHGHLVFEPVGFNDGLQLPGVRVTVEHGPIDIAVPPYGEAQIGIYRHLGLGTWKQTALITDPAELAALVPDRELPTVTQLQPQLRVL